MRHKRKPTAPFRRFWVEFLTFSVLTAGPCAAVEATTDAASTLSEFVAQSKTFADESRIDLGLRDGLRGLALPRHGPP